MEIRRGTFLEARKENIGVMLRGVLLSEASGGTTGLSPRVLHLAETPVFPLPFILLTAVLIIAAVNDIRLQKIPNWLTYPAMTVGIIYHTGLKGLEGFIFSWGGIGVGIAVLIGFYLVGGTGAGDVKLMGAVGGFLGPKGVFIAFLCTAIVGGIYAILLMALHGFLKETAKRYIRIIKTFILTKNIIYAPPTQKEKNPKLCYGVAIAVGTIISLAFFRSI